MPAFVLEYGNRNDTQFPSDPRKHHISKAQYENLKLDLYILFLWGMEGIKGVEMVAVQAKCLPYGLKFKHKRS